MMVRRGVLNALLTEGFFLFMMGSLAWTTIVSHGGAVFESLSLSSGFPVSVFLGQTMSG